MLFYGQVLHKRGQGFGILVSKVAKETNAAYTLEEPSQASFDPFVGFS